MTNKIKELADVRTQSMDDVDTVLRVCAFLPSSSLLSGTYAATTSDHRGITTGDLKLRQSAVFDKLLASHKASSEPGSDSEDGPAKKKVKANGGAANGKH